MHINAYDVFTFCCWYDLYFLWFCIFECYKYLYYKMCIQIRAIKNDSFIYFYIYFIYLFIVLCYVKTCLNDNLTMWYVWILVRVAVHFDIYYIHVYKINMCIVHSNEFSYTRSLLWNRPWNKYSQIAMTVCQNPK